MSEDELMSKAEIRAWIDTEGHIFSSPPPRTEAKIKVVQYDRESIQTFCRSVRRHRISCTVHQRGPEFRAEIYGLEEVAKVIREFGPFRTQIRREKAERFKRHLLVPPRYEGPERRRARAILGL
jgi:hypothetical protein